MSYNKALVLVDPQKAMETRNAWLEAKENELEEARKAVVVFMDIHPDATPRQARRAKDKVRFLEKFIKTVKAGYLPIPRFDGGLIDWNETPMPLHALISIKEAKDAGVFDEIRVVSGREPARSGPYPSLRRRDPLVVGIVKSGGVLEGYTEHFLIAWWRPEDLPPSALM